MNLELLNYEFGTVKSMEPVEPVELVELVEPADPYIFVKES